MRRLLATLTLACMLTACAGRVRAASEQPATASPKAWVYFEAMMAEHKRTGVEQAACVTEWTFKAKAGVLSLHIERIRAAEDIRNAHAEGVTFACYAYEGTVHTHNLVCKPSEVDKKGMEMFGVVVCPNPTRFATFTVTP